MKEPAVTCAAATTNLCVAHCNLSATIDHYKARDNLCSTTMSPWETCGDLSTAADFQLKTTIQIVL
jgi:hypothetical protein